MNPSQQLVDDAVGVDRHEYDDGVVLAADFGPVGDATVDVVDETVIVIVDGEQYDVEIEGDAQAFIHNGVLTIEVDE